MMDRERDVWGAIMTELVYARQLYPAWPSDVVHAVSIASEEAGEVTKGINDLVHHGKGSEKEIVDEAIQAADLRYAGIKGCGIVNTDTVDVIIDLQNEVARLNAENEALISWIEDVPTEAIMGAEKANFFSHTDRQAIREWIDKIEKS